MSHITDNRCRKEKRMKYGHVGVALGLFVSACGGHPEAKSIFALTANDFMTHKSFAVAPDSIKMQSLKQSGAGGLKIQSAAPQDTGAMVSKGAVLLAEAS